MDKYYLFFKEFGEEKEYELVGCMKDMNKLKEKIKGYTKFGDWSNNFLVIKGEEMNVKVERKMKTIISLK